MASADTDRLPSISLGGLVTVTTGGFNPLTTGSGGAGAVAGGGDCASGGGGGVVGGDGAWGGAKGGGDCARSGDCGGGGGGGVGGGGGGGGGGEGVTGVVAIGGGGGGSEKGGVLDGGRTRRGVGTYLIDTPKDSGLLLRQRFFTFQEQHRGVVMSQNEVLPDIPFRLHPRPETGPPTTTSTTPDRPPPPVMVDMATSPCFPDDEDLDTDLDLDGAFCARSLLLTPAGGSTFLTERAGEMTSRGARDPPGDGVTSLNVTTREGEVTSRSKTVEEGARMGKGVVVSAVLKPDKTPRAIVEPLARSMHFSERPRRKAFPRPVRDFPRLGPLPVHTSKAAGTRVEVSPERGQTTLPSLEPAPLATDMSDTARSNYTAHDSCGPKRCSSVSDVTEAGSLFSWHDKELERRPGYPAAGPDHMGPSTFFSMNKSKSLLDLLKPLRRDRGLPVSGDGDGFPGLGAGAGAGAGAGKVSRQRLITHLPPRREKSFRRKGGGGGSGGVGERGSVSSQETDKEWKDIVNTRVVDHAEYDRFASRRMPHTPAARKHPRSLSPKGGAARELRYSQADNGKLYPMFVNVGPQAKKLGRGLYNRKLMKSK